MKEKLVQNLGLKLIALVLALILWMVIVNIEDPVDTRRFSGVTVQVANESIITNNGKMYQITNGTATVDVTVSAKRSILRRIQRKDIHATADVENLQLDSMIPITITIPAYEGRYEDASTYPKNMQISIEDIESKKLPLTAEVNGTPRDGYFVESTTISPDNITINGPKSKVDEITSAAAKVNVSGITQDSELDGTLVFYNDSNQEIEQSLLTTNLGDTGIVVSVHVMETVDVPIRVSTTGTPAEGFTVSMITCEPETVALIGREEAFASLEEITVPAIDVSGCDNNVDTVVDLSDYLPEGITFANKDEGKVLISVAIESYGTKTLTFPTGSIVAEHAPSGYVVSYPNETEITIKVRGSSNILENLKASDLIVKTDLSAISDEGVYTVPLTIKTPGGCDAAESVEISIKVSKESSKTGSER